MDLPAAGSALIARMGCKLKAFLIVCSSREMGSCLTGIFPGLVHNLRKKHLAGTSLSSQCKRLSRWPYTLESVPMYTFKVFVIACSSNRMGSCPTGILPSLVPNLQVAAAEQGIVFFSCLSLLYWRSLVSVCKSDAPMMLNRLPCDVSFFFNQ